MFKIISFDIGLRTCSVSVENYDVSGLLPPPSVKYLKGGEATPEMAAYVLEVAKKGTIVHLETRDLGDKKAFFANRAFANLYEWGRSLHIHLADANIVLIEQQMKVNAIAIALMYHLHAFLLLTHPQTNVVLYPSKNKTRVAGAPLKVDKTAKDGTTKLTKVTKYQRKKWSSEYARRILQERKDSVWGEHLAKSKKKDDMSDVIMQSLSYMVTLV
jgi:hypothetical protein